MAMLRQYPGGPPPVAPPAEPPAGAGAVWVKAAMIIGLLALGKMASMQSRGAVGTQELRLIGIVVGQILLLVVALVNVEFVYYVLLFYLPFSARMPGDYGTAVNITNVLTVIVIFGLFCRSTKEGGHFFVRTELDNLMWLYLLLVFISFFRTAIAEENDWVLLVTLVKRFCTPIFMFYLTNWVVRSREQIKESIFVIMLTTLMVAFLATKDTTTPTHFSWERREAGVVAQANIMASFMAYYMFYFVSYCRMYTDNWKAWLLLLAIYPCGRSIMLTFSRGGYISFVAGALFVSYLWKKALAVAVAAVMIFVWFNKEAFLPGAVVERLDETFIQEDAAYGKKTVRMEESAQGRMEIWKGGIRMIAANPILGVGYGQFPPLLPYYSMMPYPMDAHNAYILIAAEMGLPALIVFLLITWRLFKYSLHIYTHCADRLYAALGMGYATGMVAFWWSNGFGCRFNTTETISYFWILAAIIMLIRKKMALSLIANGARNGIAPPPGPPRP
ncbi:MAG: O-antigen ligase family protein [bacterium]|nr:O-antigen ligase family protein [bacterium]